MQNCSSWAIPEQSDYFISSHYPASSAPIKLFHQIKAYSSKLFSPLKYLTIQAALAGHILLSHA